MDIVSIEKRIKYSLQHAFQKIEIVPIEINTGLIHPHRLNVFPSQEIKGISFFLNDSVRYIMFYTTVKGEVLFTRPKAGILAKLTTELRPGDFRNTLTEDYMEYGNVMGVFLDQYINQKVDQEIRKLIHTFAIDQETRTGIETKYTVGYNVIKHDKATLGYSAIFELFIKQTGSADNEFIGYSGEIENGILGQFIHRQKDGFKTTLSAVFK